MPSIHPTIARAARASPSSPASAARSAARRGVARSRRRHHVAWPRRAGVRDQQRPRRQRPAGVRPRSQRIADAGHPDPDRGHRDGGGARFAGRRRHHRQRPGRPRRQPRLRPDLAVRRTARRADARRHRAQRRGPADVGDRRRPRRVRPQRRRGQQHHRVPHRSRRGRTGRRIDTTPVAGRRRWRPGRVHAGRPRRRRHRAFHQPDRHVPRAAGRGPAGHRQRFQRRDPVRVHVRPAGECW